MHASIGIGVLVVVGVVFCGERHYQQGKDHVPSSGGPLFPTIFGVFASHAASQRTALCLRTGRLGSALMCPPGTCQWLSYSLDLACSRVPRREEPRLRRHRQCIGANGVITGAPVTPDGRTGGETDNNDLPNDRYTACEPEQGHIELTLQTLECPQL